MTKTSELFHDVREIFRDFEKIVGCAEKVVVAQVSAILERFSDNIVRIESRTKAFVSVRDNYIEKFGVPAAPIDLDEFLRDATDLIGVRIIVYRNSEVDEIRDVLRAVYPDTEIEEKLTIRDINRGSRFGYRAAHLNFSFSDDHIFRGQPRACAGVEIQIRTLLSDAWARHSHKLVYKSDKPPSDDVLRAFASTAALLETLDEQIEQIHELPQTPQRKQTSEELTWLEVYDTVCKIVNGYVDEEDLKAFYVSVHHESGVEDATAFANVFLTDVKNAWKLYGDVNYNKYGFKDKMLQIKIALYGTGKVEYALGLPLYMQSKVGDVLQVGARV